MLRPALGLMILISLVASAAMADVYRYVDKNGQVQYTDKPELLPAELMAGIKSQRTDKDAATARAATEQQQNDATSTSQANADDAKKAKKNEAADKADRCAKARERYDQVMSAQQIYSTNEKGERVNLDEKQVDQTRASAKQLMDTWCN